MEHAAIRLEAGGKTPFYEQLYAYFAAAIRSGALAPGERLPSKRRLAQDVGVSVSTVEKSKRSGACTGAGAAGAGAAGRDNAERRHTRKPLRGFASRYPSATSMA